MGDLRGRAVKPQDRKFNTLVGVSAEMSKQDGTAGFFEACPKGRRVSSATCSNSSKWPVVKMHILQGNHQMPRR